MFNKFKALPLGFQRLLIAVTIVPIIAAAIFGEDGEKIPVALIAVAGYWALVFIGLWVYDGFKK
jgi:hypothetical protein